MYYKYGIAVVLVMYALTARADEPTRIDIQAASLYMVVVAPDMERPRLEHCLDDNGQLVPACVRRLRAANGSIGIDLTQWRGMFRPDSAYARARARGE